MDNNSNDLSKFILNSSESAESSSSSLIDKIRGISLTTWIIVIFLLAFLGINIFVYLAKGTQDIANFLKPITDIFAKLFGSVTSQIVDVSAEGAKAVVKTTAGAVDSGLTGVQKLTPGDIKDTNLQPDIMKTNTLNRALNSSKQSNTQNDKYSEDDTDSNIQKGAGKAGWCYIGTDRGTRTCAQVGANDDCLSGDIFSSRDICVNPKLRA